MSDNEDIQGEMIYKIKESNNEKVSIFGYNFVKNNKDICKIIYKNKEYELKVYFNDIDPDYNNNDTINFKLKGINKITSMEGMFTLSDKVISLPDISNWDTSNVEDMREMFWGCELITSLPDISNWNTSKVKRMDSMFYGCKSLISLPDISK